MGDSENEQLRAANARLLAALDEDNLQRLIADYVTRIEPLATSFGLARYLSDALRAT